MVNHEEDLKAVVTIFGTPHDSPNNYNYRQSTGCLVKQAKTYSRTHQMCFGGLASLINDTSEYIINSFQWAQVRFASMSTKDKIFFLDYLMNRSPFSDCFLEHDAKWSVENNISYHKIEMPGNMVIAALSAVREMWEEYSMAGIIHFRKMVKAGVPEDFAWILCSYVTLRDKDIVVRSRQINGGHSTWPTQTATTTNVINYLNHEALGAFKQNFNYNYPYTGVHSLFSSAVASKEISFTEWLLKNIKYTIVENSQAAPWEIRVSGSASRIAKMTLGQWLEESVNLYDKFSKEFMK